MCNVMHARAFISKKEDATAQAVLFFFAMSWGRKGEKPQLTPAGCKFVHNDEIWYNLFFFCCVISYIARLHLMQEISCFQGIQGAQEMA